MADIHGTKANADTAVLLAQIERHLRLNAEMARTLRQIRLGLEVLNDEELQDDEDKG